MYGPDGWRDLLLWVAAMFLSVLIHELGHSLAFRMYGTGSRIVLHYLGGLAIPDSFSSRYGFHSKQQIVISAAGPGFQLGAAFLLMSAIALTGRQIPLSGFVANLLNLPIDAPGIQNRTLAIFSAHFLFVSVYWAILNLLPVYPMDGEKISQELFVLSGDREAIQHSLMLSIAVAAIVAVYAFMNHSNFMAFMFAALAYENYSRLSTDTGGGFGRQSW
jgi:Zn-dependent protease